MATLTIKEWAEEYRLINEADREDLKRRLPQESAEQSLRKYLALCALMVKLSPEAREAFAEERRQRYLALEAHLLRVARSWGHAVSP